MITELPASILAVTRDDARFVAPLVDDYTPDPKPEAPRGWVWWWVGKGKQARYSLVQIQYGPEGIYNQLDFDVNHIIVWTYKHNNPKALNRLLLPRGL